MLVKHLLEAHKRDYSGSRSISHSVSMASDDDSVNIKVEYEVYEESAEYEGRHMVHDDVSDLEDITIRPFTFEKKHYTEITPDIVGYFDFDLAFEKLPGNKALIDRAQDEDKKHPLTKKECADLVKDYLTYIFDTDVAVQDKQDRQSTHDDYAD